MLNLEPGRVIAGYEIRKLLGKGGMGNVYLAQQLSVGRDVALKILKPERLKTDQAAEKFLTEARHTAQLNHPNLVSIHDAGRDFETDLLYYTMGYVEGPTLTQLIKKQGIPAEEHVLRICRDIALGLGHAHQNGIIHRDLKPDNILITTRGEARITDLGLATDKLGNQSFNSRKVLAIVGTPEFAAPEQHRNPLKVVPASDVFSLGACLYFMMRQHEPFIGETLIDLIVRAATEDPPELDQMDDDIAELILDLMAKNPEDRPENGDAAAARIEETLQGAGSSSASRKATRSGGRRRTLGANRRRRSTRRR